MPKFGSRFLSFLLLCSVSLPVLAADKAEYDVVVYGGSASGIMAAVSAARDGAHVALVSPNLHLGGMVTNGLFRTDIGRPTVIGGIPYEFWKRGDAIYQERNIPHLTMWFTEPHLAEEIFNQMLREAKVSVFTQSRLKEKNGVKKQGARIVSINTEDGKHFDGKVFVDATYEGDLMAFAGASYIVGREPQSQFNEYSAGVRDSHSDPVSAYDEHGKLLRGVAAKRKATSETATRRRRPITSASSCRATRTIRSPSPSP